MSIDDHTDQLEISVWVKEQARIIEAQRQYIDLLLDAFEQIALDNDLEEEVEKHIQRINSL